MRGNGQSAIDARLVLCTQDAVRKNAQQALDALDGRLDDLEAAPPDDTLRDDLADTTDPAKGAALVGWKRVATGATARTSAQRFAEMVSVKDFGAVGDGVADDTAALQAALNTLGKIPNRSGRLYFPVGVYKITATLAYEGLNGLGIVLEGEVGGSKGPSGARIDWYGAAGGTMLYMLGTNGASIEHMEFNARSIAKYGIHFDSTNTEGGSDPSSVIVLRRVTIAAPSGAGSACIAFGHDFSPTMQVSEVSLYDCQIQGMATAGAGILTLHSGNIKNFAVYGGWFTAFDYGIDWNLGAGRFLVENVLFTNSRISDIRAGGSGVLTVIGCESEGETGNRFLMGTGGTNPLLATLIGNTWECATEVDDYVIDFGGCLTLIGNRFYNLRAGNSGAKVRVNNPLFTQGYPDALLSTGNFYMNVVGYAPFYDGSNNPYFDPAGFYGSLGQDIVAQSVGDFGGSIGSPARLRSHFPNAVHHGATILRQEVIRRYAAGQTDNLSEWQDQANAVLSQVSPAGLFQVADGNAGAPGYGFKTDPDTGPFRVGANILGFSTGGTERLRVNAAGNTVVQNGFRFFAADGAAEETFSSTRHAFRYAFNGSFGGTYQTLQTDLLVRPTGAEYGTAIASAFNAIYDAGSDGSTMSMLLGARMAATLSGAATGRTVVFMVGGDFVARAQGSTATTIHQLVGSYFQIDVSGQNQAVGVASCAFIPVPGAPGSGSTIGTLRGVFVDDMSNRATANYGIYIENQTPSGNNYALFSNGGPVRLLAGTAANNVFTVKGAASQTGDLVQHLTSGDAILGRINKDGYWMTRKVAAPADGDLAASELSLWFDAANGAAKLKIKGKSANGTVVVGEVALA